MANFSVIIWSSDPQETEGLCIPSLTPPWQLGEHEVETITVPPAARAKNMGQVYTHGKSMARFPIKIYVHQDVIMEDRRYLTKLASMLEEDPGIGVVGIVGSAIDTGGGFFHAPTIYRKGEIPEPKGEHDGPDSFLSINYDLQTAWGTRFVPDRCEVKIIDCLLFASPLGLDFATCYFKTHMVAEDYCMRAREAGKSIWILDSQVKHFSQGTLDQYYWESIRIFRRKWKRRLPSQLPPVATLRYTWDVRYEKNLAWQSAWEGIEIREPERTVA